MTMSSDSHEVVLRLTGSELDALDAVRNGVGALAARGVDRESAVIAAVELALVRLIEDFDLPEPDAGTVRDGLGSLRSAWSRGNACLT
jgi:hypothetical protein